MNDELRDQIYNNMSLKETDELVKIWQKHNSNQWTDLAFEVVGEILRDRLGELPPQSPENQRISSKFDKDYLPSWCEDCYCEGYIFADNFELPYSVICKTCGYETSYVWCPKCQSGGAFIDNIGTHPFSWTCSICKTKYELPNGFYDEPINLFTIAELPANVQERIEEDRKAAQWFSLNNLPRELWRLVKFLLILVGLPAVFLLPFLLVFTPLPWTIPGFIATLLVFAGWWWLVARLIKSMQKKPRKRRA